MSSDLKITMIPLLVLIVLFTVTYYRLRDHVFDLARASESMRSDVFWVGVALAISAFMVWLCLAVHSYFLTHSY